MVRRLSAGRRRLRRHPRTPDASATIRRHPRTPHTSTAIRRHTRTPRPLPPFIATHAPRSPPPPFIAIHALPTPPPPFAATSSTQPCHTIPSQRRLRGHPAWRYDRRVDSFGTMNCGRSSSVEWKLPKLQRRVRFPSPAPPPPGRVPGGFVMPASRPPSTECGGTIGAKLSPRKLGARRSGTKLAPHTPRGGIFGIKLALLAQNGLIWRVLLSLGEFFPVFVANKPSRANFVPLPPTTSPVRHQSRYKTRPARATHRHFRYKTRPAHPALAFWRLLLLLGEFCPVFIANKPSRANFLPHKPQHQHRIERNNTPTQRSKPRGETFTAPAPHTNPRGETFTAPARHKQPKITHFHHAGANFLSTTGVKTKPTNSRMQFRTAPHHHNLTIRRIPTI